MVWTKQIKHLPVDTMLTDLGEPPGTFEELIKRTPADPAWRTGGLYHDDMGWGVPALWFNSWYDVSIGPNLELFNHARTANTDAKRAPTNMPWSRRSAHCQYSKLSSETEVGERSMGDARFDVDGTIFAWFDRWLKGDKTRSHRRRRTSATSSWARTRGSPRRSGRRSPRRPFACICAAAAVPTACMAMAGWSRRLRPPTRSPINSTTIR